MERNTVLVLDASVILKWYKEEEDSDKALEIRDKFIRGEIQISVPDLVLYEMANALRYSQQCTADDIARVIDNFSKFKIDIVVPTTNLIKKAGDMAMEYDITVYDGVYLALAEDLAFSLVTADLKFYRKIETLSRTQFLNPEKLNV